jgi:predicted metal-dependent HD superfamily phosphohydrolase
VRREYEWVDEEGWRKGRGELLRGFLGRERIFYSELFWGLLEEQARGNLERAVARLG